MVLGHEQEDRRRRIRLGERGEQEREKRPVATADVIGRALLAADGGAKRAPGLRKPQEREHLARSPPTRISHEVRAQIAPQLPERRARSPLLGLLLALPEGRAETAAAEPDAHLERLRVIGARGRKHDVAGRGFGRVLGPVQEQALPVAPSGLGHRVLDQDPEMPLDERRRLLQPGVEEDRGDQRLDGVREQRRRDVRAGREHLPDDEELLEPELLSDLGEALAAHDVSSRLRQPAFLEIGVLVEEHVARDRPEDGVAEELEALVAPAGVELGRGVGQRGEQEVAVREPVSQAFLAPDERGGIQSREAVHDSSRRGSKRRR